MNLVTGALNGAFLLDELSAYVGRFVAMSQPQADVCAAWIVHTHTVEATDFTPYLEISSPVLRSGKTRLLEVLRLVVVKPWFTGRVSGAALVRKTDKEHPTLLLDESDTAFNQGDYSEKLRGILNTGFERDGLYSMCVPIGNDWESHDFSTFSPKAIAGLGKLPPTLQDRAIPIRLKRALRNEPRQRLRKRKVKPQADNLRQLISDWAGRNLTSLARIEPDLPDELNDRQQDVCEPLLAIAELAGSGWPDRIRKGLVALFSVSSGQEGSQGITLLEDIRGAFCRAGNDRISTQDLLKELSRIETSPWFGLDRGRTLLPYGLSRLLLPFGIRPKDLRFGGATRKGYLRADCEESWARYLPEDARKGQQGQQAAADAPLSEIDKGKPSASVADAESEEIPVNLRVVADVAPSWEALGDRSTRRIGTKPNGANHCSIHPANKTRWWVRGGVDPVCRICHPNPLEL
jgi:hypothetical protein